MQDELAVDSNVDSEFSHDFFTFLNEFADKNNMEELTIYMNKRQVQDSNNSYCGVFCLYFTFNLFNPRNNSKIIEDKLCSITTIKKLFTELFPISQSIKDFTIDMRKFSMEYNIRGDFE